MAALDTITEALGVVERCGERFYEAELYRLKGEVLRESEPTRAVGCFQAALAIARCQHAGALERRILTALATVTPEPSG
jgi:hypothetical protein